MKRLAQENIMNKIRDFIYNTSDIVITVIIIVAATALIAWRVDIISQYSTSSITDNEIRADINKNKTDNGIKTSTKDIQDKNADDVNAENSGNDEAATDEDVAYSVTVPFNSSEKDIANILIDAKLIESAEELHSAIEEAGAAGKLKDGTFSIPANATALDIVKIMTS